MQSKAKMHCALRRLASADTREILHNRGKAVFVCKHPKAPILSITGMCSFSVKAWFWVRALGPVCTMAVMFEKKSARAMLVKRSLPLFGHTFKCIPAILAEGYYMKNHVVGLADRWPTHFRLRVNTVSIIAYLPFTMFSYTNFF